MNNFYEILDEIFNKVDRKKIPIEEIALIKEQIINAYEITLNKDCKYISEILTIKNFTLNDNGKIQKK